MAALGSAVSLSFTAGPVSGDGPAQEGEGAIGG